MKTSELIGSTLDWAVAKCEGKNGVLHDDGITRCIMLENAKGLYAGRFNPSTDWSQGGPIIEREEIELTKWGLDGWGAKATNYQFLNTSYENANFCEEFGPTPLIAAMRCFVASRLGDEVDIPEELV